MFLFEKTRPFFYLRLFLNRSHNTCIACVQDFRWGKSTEADTVRNGFVGVFKARECPKGPEKFGESGKNWEICVFLVCIFR